jgi:hypothetical protein
VVVHDVKCREVVELVTDFLEGTLPIDRRDLFERHMAMCTWCQIYLDQVRETLSVVGHLREDDVPAELVDSLALAFRAARPRHGDGPAGNGG